MQVIIFYLFCWWFKKLENKKEIVVRIVLSIIVAILFLLSTIAVFTEPHIVADGFAPMGIISLIPTIAFGLRICFDIKKLIEINHSSDSRPQPKKQTSNGDYLSNSNTVQQENKLPIMRNIYDR